MYKGLARKSARTAPTMTLSAYSQPHQFEPLLPQFKLSDLAERTRSVIEKALRLQCAVAPSTCKALQGLVRGMNSY